MAGLDQVADEFMKGKSIIVASVIYKLEVLLRPNEQAKLDQFTKRKNFQPVQVTERIIDAASEIRTHYKGNISTPDSIHLATAILNKADVFHTFDGASPSGNTKLLKLNGDAGVRGLHIIVPCLPQQTLAI